MIRCRASRQAHPSFGAPARLARPTPGIQAGFMLLLLSLLIGTACENTSTMNTPVPSDRSPLQELSQPLNQEQALAFIGQPFPASASNIHLLGEAALDTQVIARFDVPRQDVAAYLASLGVTAPLERNYSYSPFLSPDPPLAGASSWWAPPVAGDAAGNFSGLYQQVGSKHYNLAVIEAAEGLARVYLQVYNT